MEICKQNCMNTIDEYDFEVETMVNHPKNEFDSTSNSIMTTRSTQQLDAIIESAIMKKKALDMTMDLVTNLMKEVEFEEEAAVKAKEESAQFSIDTLVMMDERKKALLEQQELNSTLVKKVNAEKNVLAIKTEMLYHRVARMLDVGDKSLDVLKEMREGLDLRLNSALKEKELANEKIQENESALANETIELNKVVEEYYRLKQDTLENSKLQMLLNDRDNVVDKLKGEICDKFQDVNVLKEDLQKEEVEIPPNDSCLENLEEHEDSTSNESCLENLEEHEDSTSNESCLENLEEHKDCVTEEKVTMSSEGFEKNDSEENDALNKLHANRMAAKGINQVLEDDDDYADIFTLIMFVIIFFVISLITEFFPWF